VKKVVILSVGFVVLLAIALFFLFQGSHAVDIMQANAVISSFEGQKDLALTLHQKAILFKAYLDKKDLIKALRLADQLKDVAAGLSKPERVFIAGNVGKILRIDSKYDLEFMIYDKFLKTTDAEQYHIFRAESYEFRGDKANAKMEFLQAKQFSASPELKKLIETELAKFS
jgi:hypothetical protein